MKKLFFIFVCAAIAAACSSEMEVPSPANPDDDMVEVSFNLGGDYVSVEETPMTRVFNKDAKTIYAVQISTIEDLRLVHMTLFPGYAHGLFTDKEKIRLKIRKGEYRFSVLAIKEREDIVPNENGVYCFNAKLFDQSYPLEDGLSKDVTCRTCITNEFALSDTTLNLSDVVSPMQRMEKFYGSKTINVTDEGPVSIDLNRESFAITYKVTPPLDGNISVYLDEQLLYKVFYIDSYKEEQVIYEPKHKKYDATLKVKWERSNAEAQGYEEIKTLNIESNKNLILNIDMNDRVDENQLEINMDEKEYTNENITVK